MVVQVQLPLGWNTYLLFNTDIVNFVWKTNGGESIVLLFFVLWRCLNFRWMKGRGKEGWGQWGSGVVVVRKSYLRPAEIVSFSSQSFSHLNQI